MVSLLHRVVAASCVSCILMSVNNSCMRNADQDPNRLEVNSKSDLYVYLDSLEKNYEDACIRMGVANWNSYSKESSYDLNAAKAGFAALFADTGAREDAKALPVTARHERVERTDPEREPADDAGALERGRRRTHR